MGNKDIVSGDYMADNEHFADLLYDSLNYASQVSKTMIS